MCIQLITFTHLELIYFLTWHFHNAAIVKEDAEKAAIDIHLHVYKTNINIINTFIYNSFNIFSHWQP